MANNSKFTQTLELKVTGIDQLSKANKGMSDVFYEINRLKSVGEIDKTRYDELITLAKKKQKQINEASAKSIESIINNFGTDIADDSNGNSKKDKNDPKKDAVNKAVSFFGEQMKKQIQAIGNLFVTTFKNAYNNLAEMATYSSGSTLMTNSAARQQQLVYGLSDSENFAMKQAMSMLGMSGNEDLMWMNTAQAEEYKKLTAIFKEQYTYLQNSGVMQSVQEMQLDFALMKEQFQMTVYQFIADHQAEILGFMNLVGNVMNALLTFMGWVVDILGSISKNFDYQWSSVTTPASSSVDNSKNASIVVNYTSSTGNDDGISKQIYDSVIAALG